MDIFTITGLAGVAAYVLAYGLLQIGQLDGNGLGYSALNVLAAALVLVSLTSDFNLASAITQIIWILIGVAGIAGRFFYQRRDCSTIEPAHALAPPPAVQPGPSVAAVGSLQPSLALRPDLAPTVDRS